MVEVMILFHSEVPMSDCKLTIKGLTLLEQGAGIPILQQLQANKDEFLRKLRIRQKTPLNDALETWLNKPILSHIEPTWRNLYCILRLMYLDSLVNKIEDYLSQLTKPRSSSLVTTEQHDVQDHCGDHQPVLNQLYYAIVFYQNRTVYEQRVLIYFSVIQSCYYVSQMM